MFARRLEIKFFREVVEKRCGRALPDAHRSVALHVRVAAHRADASAGLANLSAKEKQVDDLLNVGDGVPVLRESHCPATDCALRLNHHLGSSVYLFTRDSALLDDV